MHNAFIKPYLRAWFMYLGGAPKTTLCKIDRNIRKTLRIMMFRKRRDSSLFPYKNHWEF